jgi:succinate dehydrogenase / fumarate reductase membrane anchor subunit
MSNIGTAGTPEGAPRVEYRAPLKRVRGLGSAKAGVVHWWRQRLTAIVLLLLAPWLVGLLVSFVGADAASARDVVARPWNAVALSAFLIAGFWHAKLGMQVVIEDYVHVRWIELTLQVLVTLVCALAALASLYAVAHIAMTAVPFSS